MADWYLFLLLFLCFFNKKNSETVWNRPFRTGIPQVIIAASPGPQPVDGSYSFGTGISDGAAFPTPAQ